MSNSLIMYYTQMTKFCLEKRSGTEPSKKMFVFLKFLVNVRTYEHTVWLHMAGGRGLHTVPCLSSLLFPPRYFS